MKKLIPFMCLGLISFGTSLASATQQAAMPGSMAMGAGQQNYQQPMQGQQPYNPMMAMAPGACPLPGTPNPNPMMPGYGQQMPIPNMPNQMMPGQMPNYPAPMQQVPQAANMMGANPMAVSGQAATIQ